MWLGIDHADSAKYLAAFRDNRRTGVEADLWIALHKRIVAKALILAGIFDDQRFGIRDRVRTEAL